MQCINCNFTIPEGTYVCPACNVKQNTDFVRCPECFVKIRSTAKSCPKCGCDLTLKKIEKYELNQENTEQNNLLDTQKNKKLKIVIISSALAAIIALSLIIGICNSGKNKKYISDAVDCVETVQYNMKLITELAEKYNTVYDGKWLKQIENIEALEKQNRDVITELKEARDDINYIFKTFEKECNSEQGRKAAESVLDSYTECYLYVVEKYGTYPGYKNKYNELYAKYKSDLKMFNEYIENIK